MKISLYLIDSYKGVKPDEKPISECDNLIDAEDMAVKYANEHGLKGSEQIAILAGTPDDCVLLESIKAEYVPKRPEKVYINKPLFDKGETRKNRTLIAIYIVILVLNILLLIRQ